MNRMEFFRNVILGSGALILMNSTLETARPLKQKIMLGSHFIAGFQFYDGPEVADMLECDLPLTFNREPHNRWDKNAVEVYAGEAKLGYVPRGENQVIAQLMDQGIDIKALISELSPEAFPHGSVKMEVWYEKEFK